MDTTVKTFFENYAEALISFSAEKISEFYQVPLTVYSDQGIQQVTKMKEVTAFWEQGVKPYKAQHIEKTIAEVLTEEQLSEKIFISKVLWKNYDSTGKEIARETNVYILTPEKKELKISGLILMAPFS